MGEWVDTYFDNTYWQNGGEYWQCQWDGTKWVSGIYSYNIDLFVVGDWATGFRPTKLKIYHNKPSPFHAFLRPVVDYVTIGSGLFYSGSEIDLDFSDGSDFYGLYAETGDDYSAITGISFYVEESVPVINQPQMWIIP